MKLVALYKQPQDQQSFENAYFNSHLPLIKKVPGLQETKITRFSRTLMGDDLYMMAEMYFTDSSSLKVALRSPEMAAAAENLNSFASGLVTLLIGEDQNQPIGSQ